MSIHSHQPSETTPAPAPLAPERPAGSATAKALEPPGWSKRRWIGRILGLFLAQTILILWVDHQGIPLQERPILRTSLRLAVDERSVSNISELVSHEDPMLLALPSLRGFSGPAWLEFAPPDYQPAEPEESPYWLQLQPSAFGADFASLLATSSIAPPLVADKPIPRLRSYEPNPLVSSITTESRLRIEGDLAGRPLLNPVELPPWRNSEVLSNTVVQVAADADGVPVFTAVLGQSGSKDVDNYALDVAGRARFQPLRRSRAPGVPPPENLAWGSFVFQWHTIPMPVTNPAVELPP